MILVIGTTTVDLLVSGFDRLPRLEGDEFTVNSLVFCREPLRTLLGGNGANSAYVLGKLGAETALCSAIGRDALGGLVEAWLHEANVDTAALVRTPSQATPTTTMLLDAASNRLSFHHAGPSFTFDSSALDASVLGRATAVLVTGYPLLRAWRPEGIQRVLVAAKKQGATTALDLGPAIYPPARLEELRPLLPQIDVLLCNTYELGVCTDTRQVQVGVRVLQTAGAQGVVVKQGPTGAVLSEREGALTPVAGFPADVPFTVGAGDAFNAGLLFALTSGHPLLDAVRFANATAALVVRSGQGVLGSPTATEVEALVQSAEVDP